jgi:hypothetical protein
MEPSVKPGGELHGGRGPCPGSLSPEELLIHSDALDSFVDQSWC